MGAISRTVVAGESDPRTLPRRGRGWARGSACKLCDGQIQRQEIRKPWSRWSAVRSVGARRRGPIRGLRSSLMRSRDHAVARRAGPLRAAAGLERSKKCRGRRQATALQSRVTRAMGRIFARIEGYGEEATAARGRPGAAVEDRSSRGGNDAKERSSARHEGLRTAEAGLAAAGRDHGAAGSNRIQSKSAAAFSGPPAAKRPTFAPTQRHGLARNGSPSGVKLAPSKL